MTTTTGRNTAARNTKSATGARRTKAKSSAPAESGEVAAGVAADLATFPADLAQSGLARLALALAREIDNAGNSATAKSMCAGQLQAALDRLYALKPSDTADDNLDDLAKKREQRLARLTAASDR
jgi:hypothetical protein